MWEVRKKGNSTIRMSLSNSLEIYLKKLSCVTLTILFHKVIMHLLNKKYYPDHYYSKKYWLRDCCYYKMVVINIIHFYLEHFTRTYGEEVMTENQVESPI